MANIYEDELKKDYENRCDKIAEETIKIIVPKKLSQEQFRELISQQLKLCWFYFEPYLTKINKGF